MRVREVLRIAFVVLLSGYCLALALPDIALPWHPFSTYGYSARPGDGTVVWVDASAAGAGLRVGDTIDTGQLTLADKMRLARFSPLAPTGAVVQVPLTSGRSVTLTAHPYPRTLIDNIADVAQMFGYLAIVGIASMLLLMRPLPATWAFYFAAIGMSFAPATLTLEYAAPSLLVVLSLSRILLATVGRATVVSFALRFPNVECGRAAKTFERVLLFGLTPFAILTSGLSVVGVAWAQLLNPYVFQGFLWSTALVAAFILLARYAGAAAEMRSRLQWIVASFAVAFIPAGIVISIENAGFFPPIWIVNLSYLFQVVAPVAVAYTVFKHRLFDLRLIVSRAVLYAVLTSIMVTLLGLLDWAMGRWLAESRFALAAELVLAVGVGVLLSVMHRRIETLLNNVIFRAQALALQAVRRFSHETDLIADPHLLLQQTGEVLRTRLETDYIAIYTADGSSYALVTPPSPGIPSLLAAHDLAVLRLRRWHEPFECEEPAHPLAGALLLPMTARGQLVGFIGCGPKHDRTHYLPDEVETLALLSHRTGSAYALLTLAAQ